MKKIMNILLGLMIITTSILSAQDCAKRINRYEQDPGVVTVYACNSILIKNDVKEYQVSILVDSIHATSKIYRLYADFNLAVEYPQFEVELTSGQMVTIYANFETDQYMEAVLTPDQVKLFREKRVKNITIWHAALLDKPNPKVPCETFFSDFLAKY